MSILEEQSEPVKQGNADFVPTENIGSIKVSYK
jgi:hypothetical protein